MASAFEPLNWVQTVPLVSFGPPVRPLWPHRVSTATPGAPPLSPVQLDFFQPLTFEPPPDFLYVHRAQ